MAGSSVEVDEAHSGSAVVLSYQLTNWDLARLAWVHPVWSPWLYVAVAFVRSWARILRIASKPVLAFVGTTTVGVGLGIGSTTLVACGFLLLLLLPVGLVKTAVLYQLRRRYAPRGMSARYEVQATPDALVWRCDGREMQVPWQSIRTVYDLPCSVIFDAPLFGNLLLPKRAFVDRSAQRAFVWQVGSRRGAPVPRFAGAFGNSEERPTPRWAWVVLAFAAAVLVAVIVVQVVSRLG